MGRKCRKAAVMFDVAVEISAKNHMRRHQHHDNQIELLCPPICSDFRWCVQISDELCRCLSMLVAGHGLSQISLYFWAFHIFQYMFMNCADFQRFPSMCVDFLLGGTSMAPLGFSFDPWKSVTTWLLPFPFSAFQVLPWRCSGSYGARDVVLSRGVSGV